MKKNRQIWRSCLVMLMSLAMLLACVPMWAAAEDAVTVEVASLLGTVTVKRAASEKTFNAFVGLKLKQGDVVTVAPGGEVVVHIGEDKVIKALADSSFKISSLSGSNSDSQAGFTLIKGTVFNEVRAPQSSTEGMTVRTGNTVAGVRGTTYSVSLRAQDGVTVRTLEGSVFLDRVLGRIEADTNASLVTEQQTVSAGQGSSTVREDVYTLTISDFTAAELTYIIEHAQDFDADLVAEAQSALDSMPAETQVAESQRLIVYETEDEAAGDSGSESGDESYVGDNTGGEEPPAPPTTRTLTIRYGGDPDFTGYYGHTVTLDITQANMSARLYDYLKYNCGPGNFPGKVGYYISGWSLTHTGTEGTGGSRDFYDNHTLADLPADSHVTLYPLFAVGGDIGTYENPYSITRDNFPHFVTLARNDLALHFNLNEDIDYTDYHWPADWQWRPIGDADHPFTGSFDGDGKIIRNFSMTTTQQYAGLFGCVKGFENNSVVFDLTLDNAAITASGSTEAVGSLVGSLISGTVENCTVSGTVSATGSNVHLSVGGLVGMADQLSVGSGADPIISASIIGSAFEGTVTATATGIHAYAGGIAGRFESFSLMGCTADASVTASSTHGVCAGGIAGKLADSDFSGNRFAANGRSIIGTSSGNADVYVGGMAGYADASIEQCAVSGSGYTIESIGGMGYVGGIVGNGTGANSFVNACAVSGATLSVSSSYGVDYIGGIGGSMDSDATTVITNCYVQNTRVTATHSAARAGGIAGDSYQDVEHCYVRDVDITIADTATAYGGGIAGMSTAEMKGCVVFSGSINRGTPVLNALCMRIISPNSMGSVTACHGVTGEFVIGTTTVVAGDPKDGADKAAVDVNQAFFSDLYWNFTDIWQWDSAGYPTLINAPIP